MVGNLRKHFPKGYFILLIIAIIFFCVNIIPMYLPEKYNFIIILEKPLLIIQLIYIIFFID